MDDKTSPQAPAPSPTAPPQVIYIQGEPRRGHRIRNVAIGCVAGVAGLAILGGTVGTPTPWNGSPGYQGPTYTVTTPTPIPPLSRIPAKIQTSAYVAVHSLGNQSWVDVSPYLTNQGDRPAQDVTVYLEQNGQPLTITDSGGWNPVPNGVQIPILGVAATQPVTLRVEAWQPGVPITIRIVANGVANDASMLKVACPTTKMGDSIACTLPGA